jgi:hypothetical protein
MIAGKAVLGAMSIALGFDLVTAHATDAPPKGPATPKAANSAAPAPALESLSTVTRHVPTSCGVPLVSVQLRPLIAPGIRSA